MYLFQTRGILPGMFGGRRMNEREKKLLIEIEKDNHQTLMRIAQALEHIARCMDNE